MSMDFDGLRSEGCWHRICGLQPQYNHMKGTPMYDEYMKGYGVTVEMQGSTWVFGVGGKVYSCEGLTDDKLICDFWHYGIHWFGKWQREEFMNTLASIQPIDVPVEALAATCEAIDNMRENRIG